MPCLSRWERIVYTVGAGCALNSASLQLSASRATFRGADIGKVAARTTLLDDISRGKVGYGRQRREAPHRYTLSAVIAAEHQATRRVLPLRYPVSESRPPRSNLQGLTTAFEPVPVLPFHLAGCAPHWTVRRKTPQVCFRSTTLQAGYPHGLDWR